MVRGFGPADPCGGAYNVSDLFKVEPGLLGDSLRYSQGERVPYKVEHQGNAAVYMADGGVPVEHEVNWGTCGLCDNHVAEHVGHCKHGAEVKIRPLKLSSVHEQGDPHQGRVDKVLDNRGYKVVPLGLGVFVVENGLKVVKRQDSPEEDKDQELHGGSHVHQDAGDVGQQAPALDIEQVVEEERHIECGSYNVPPVCKIVERAPSVPKEGIVKC